MNTITSDVALVKQIVEVLDDPSSFTDEKEYGIKGKLASVYAAFTKDRGLESDIRVSCLKTRLMGILETYWMSGKKTNCLILYVSRICERQGFVRKVQIRSKNEHLELAQHLKELLETEGIKVSLDIETPPSPQKDEETDWTDRIDNRPDFNSGGRFY